MAVARALLGTVAMLVAVAVTAPAGATEESAPDPHRRSQWGLERIEAEAAWDVASGEGVVIAVVDTGVDLGHPDLEAKIVYHPNADFVEPRGRCTTDPEGHRVCTQDGAQDRNGHGTHVAGIAAATTHNGIGIAGVAPGALILPVRVLDRQGEGTTQDVADGIRFAADRGAQVINLSLSIDAGEGGVEGLLGRPAPIYAAIDHAWEQGVVIVVAAGNQSVPLCGEPSAHDKALCVGATDTRDLRSYYSNSDTTASQLFLVAPGGDELACSGDIFSTMLRTVSRSPCSPEAGYDTDAGTSMAAPHVSGVAALLAQGGLTNDAIVECLLDTADDLGAPGRDSIYGYGRVNALNAVSACL